MRLVTKGCSVALLLCFYSTGFACIGETTPNFRFNVLQRVAEYTRGDFGVGCMFTYREALAMGVYVVLYKGPSYAYRAEVHPVSFVGQKAVIDHQPSGLLEQVPGLNILIYVTAPSVSNTREVIFLSKGAPGYPIEGSAAIIYRTIWLPGLALKAGIEDILQRSLVNQIAELFGVGYNPELPSETMRSIGTFALSKMIGMDQHTFDQWLIGIDQTMGVGINLGINELSYIRGILRGMYEAINMMFTQQPMYESHTNLEWRTDLYNK